MNAPALFDAVARIARHEAGARSIAAIGEVTAAHDAGPGSLPPDHAVTITLRDSGLSLPRVPVAVGVMGEASIPAVGELVVVLFLEGDIHSAVVVGRLYHNDLAPPTHKAGELILALPAGSDSPKFLREITGDPATYRLTLPGDVIFEMVENTALLKAGEVQAEISASGGGRIELTAGGTKLTLKKDGDLSIEAAGNLAVEATDIEIKGRGNVKISGAMVEVN